MAGLVHHPRHPVRPHGPLKLSTRPSVAARRSTAGCRGRRPGAAAQRGPEPLTAIQGCRDGGRVRFVWQRDGWAAHRRSVARAGHPGPVRCVPVPHPRRSRTPWPPEPVTAGAGHGGGGGGQKVTEPVYTRPFTRLPNQPSFASLYNARGGGGVWVWSSFDHPAEPQTSGS